MTPLGTYQAKGFYYGHFIDLSDDSVHVQNVNEELVFRIDSNAVVRRPDKTVVGCFQLYTKANSRNDCWKFVNEDGTEILGDTSDLIKFEQIVCKQLLS